MSADRQIATRGTTAASTPNRHKADAPLTWECFRQAVARLEAAKVQAFSRETLEVWYFAFVQERWTNRKFLDRAAAVLKMPQVRRDVTIDDFFNAPPATDKEVLDDARWLAEEIRRRNLQAMKDMKLDDEAIRREGWRMLHEEYQLAFSERLQTVTEQLRDRCQAARKALTAMTDEQVRTLYADAVLKGVLKPVDDLVERSDVFLRGWLRAMMPMKSNYDHEFRTTMEAYIMTNPYDVLALIEKKAGAVR